MLNENRLGEASVIVGCMRLGLWGQGFNTQQYEYFIDGCIDLGAVDFDHADIYGNYTTEKEFGDVLKRRPDLRSKLRITTKCGIKMPCDNRPDYKLKSYDSSPEHIIESVDNSLSNLSIDQIDLLLLHRPDLLMDVTAISDCFAELKSQGKVSHFGVSNFNVHQVSLLQQKTEIAMHQCEISLFNLENLNNGVVDQCMMNSINVSSWSPFGGGQLFDVKENKYSELKNSMQKMADKYNCTIAEIAIAWLNTHPSGIIPVLGTSKLDRVAEAIKARGLVLSKEEWYRLLEDACGREVL